MSQDLIDWIGRSETLHDTITGIRLCMALTTSLTSIAALLVLPFYRLDKARAASIRAQLEAGGR